MLPLYFFKHTICPKMLNALSSRLPRPWPTNCSSRVQGAGVESVKHCAIRSVCVLVLSWRFLKWCFHGGESVDWCFHGRVALLKWCSRRNGCRRVLVEILKKSESLELLRRRPNLVLPLPGLLRQQNLVNVRQNPSVGNRHRPQKLAQLLVVPHRELHVPRYDPSLLVVPRRIVDKFKNLGGKVLEHGGEVDGGSGADALGVAAGLQCMRRSADDGTGGRPCETRRRTSSGRGRLSSTLENSFRNPNRDWMIRVEMGRNIGMWTNVISSSEVRKSRFS
ncbi:hypothetical protein Sjap_008550 [Stephania japonica]|uniref:Uncharacterized protein n=1 Tax=Stephania japonica TaxID=461633 RepID=A0AAP0JQF0_9MAGN